MIHTELSFEKIVQIQTSINNRCLKKFIYQSLPTIQALPEQLAEAVCYLIDYKVCEEKSKKPNIHYLLQKSLKVKLLRTRKKT